jgi:hypothetical protein
MCLCIVIHLHVSMYVCLVVFVFVCLYVCVCVCVHVHVYTRAGIIRLGIGISHLCFYKQGRSSLVIKTPQGVQMSQSQWK